MKLEHRIFRETTVYHVQEQNIGHTHLVIYTSITFTFVHSNFMDKVKVRDLISPYTVYVVMDKYRNLPFFIAKNSVQQFFVRL